MNPASTALGLACAATLFAAPCFAQSAKDLVGKYQMDASAEETMELRANGTAAMSGDEVKWSVKGNVLTIGEDSVPFQLKGGKLTLTMGQGIQLTWTRVGAAGKGKSPLQKAASKAQKKDEVSEADADAEAMAQAQAWLAKNQGTQAPARAGAQPMGQPLAQPQAAGGSPQDVQVRQLLLSRAWCSFSYSQTSGTSRTTRAVFRPDGILSFGSGAETYSSGAGGTVAGQHGANGFMRWQVVNGRLYVDEGGGLGPQDVNMTITLNSSGYPIIKAAGKEYSGCN
jgi:hypothetical protein